MMIIIMGIIIVITMLMMSMMIQQRIASPIDYDRLSLHCKAKTKFFLSGGTPTLTVDGK